jgi:hypothetical protein
MTLAAAVYILCAATSVACAWMLFDGYRRTRTALLFWSSLCFMLLAVNNGMLLIDFFTGPALDLSIKRSLVALVAVLLLLYGLIWESK